MSTPKTKRQTVFLDISIADEPIGRIVIELFNDIVPKTAANFYHLCCGDKGNCSTDASKLLCYKGCKFHRIIKNFMIQSGDITKGNGIGGESIYGPYFDDESFQLKHDKAGLCSMANSGANRNSSQFFITCSPQKHLDGKHVVFGHVIKGMNVVNVIQNLPTKNYRGNQHKPKYPVKITECGDLSVWQQIESNLMQQEQLRALDDDHDEEHVFHALSQSTQTQKSKGKEEETANTAQPTQPSSSSSTQKQTNSNTKHDGADEQKAEQSKVDDDPLKQKLFELRMKRNEARKLNKNAMMDEYTALNESANDSKKNANKRRKRKRKELVDTASYLHESAEYAQNMEERKKRKVENERFGWNVFNDDTLYRAYEKRIAAKNMNPNNERKEGFIANTKQLANVNSLDYAQQSEEDELNEENVDNMVNELNEQREKRKKYQRRRTYYQDADVSYINKRNMVFNKKVERAYGAYTAEIRANLERGTAL